ncbi:MAG: tetratricopeptide repeat protein [Candidatus Eremiobacteraeota bacterium]|nr:tetratricopeptide repeat protein [Candidatus Eremiobacteraeota bacterium]
MELRAGWSAPPGDVGAARHGNPFLDHDEAEYGWNADTFKMPVKKPVDDDWVDQEVDLRPQEGWKHPEDFEDVRVTVVRPKARKPGDPTLLLLSAVVGLCLIVLGSFLWKQTRTDDGADERPPAVVAMEEAETWLASADESLAKKEYQLAAAQLEKGIGFLVKGKAEQATVDEVRVKLASALEADGHLKSAHQQWSDLVGTSPEAPSRKAGLEKQLRVQANGLLEQSQAARKAGDSKKAVTLAQQAFDLYQAYGGSPEQKARSLESMARANLADNRRVAAESNLQQAQTLAWSDERARLLSEIAPKSVSSRPVRTVRRPTVEEPNKVPRAYKPAESEYPQAPVAAPTRGERVAIPVYNPRAPVPPTQPPPPDQPVQYQPPPNSPAYNQSGGQQTEHLGDDGVLESYRSSGPKTGSGVPGYR